MSVGLTHDWRDEPECVLDTLAGIRTHPAPVPRPKFIVDAGRPTDYGGPTVRLRFEICAACGEETRPGCKYGFCPQAKAEAEGRAG